MSNELDQLVQQTHEANLKQQAAQKAAAELQESEAMFTALTEVSGWVIDDLNDVHEMLESRLEYTAVRDSNGGFKVTAKFRDGEVRFCFANFFPERRSSRWAIEVFYSNNSYPDLSRSCERAELRGVLLSLMGEVREKQESIAAKEQRQKLVSLAKAAGHAWNTAARQVQEAQERVEAYRIDAEITEMMSQRIDAARTDLWRWRNHAEITFYQLRWNTGGWSSFEDGAKFDYSVSYTITDELDERGYITVFGTYAARAIKLDMEAHKPTWERLTASSIEQLPFDLKRKIELRIDGIGYENGLLVYRKHDSVTPAVGEVPVEWVQRVVTATIAGLHGYLNDDYYTAPVKPITTIAAKIAYWHSLFGTQDATTGEIDWLDPDYALSEGMIDAEDVELYRAYIAAHRPAKSEK